jgi:hypothetical protein
VNDLERRKARFREEEMISIDPTVIDPLRNERKG